MANPGYTMAKVTGISHDETSVIVSLACGHVLRWIPYPGYTPQSYARHVQEPPDPVIVGKTQLRCAKQHE